MRQKPWTRNALDGSEHFVWTPGRWLRVSKTVYCHPWVATDLDVCSKRSALLVGTQAHGPSGGDSGAWGRGRGQEGLQKSQSRWHGPPVDN